jgi:catechol 2,3-dioxygenase-like lactoylglutathione lyase family enzyme
VKRVHVRGSNDIVKQSPNPDGADASAVLCEHLTRRAQLTWRVTRQKEASMATVSLKPRVTSFAPQFLVDDVQRSIAYYRKLGFRFGEPWAGFYAIGDLDGLELHLKEAPKNQSERRHRRDNEHVDAAAGVDGIEAFYEQCVGSGATILKPLAATAWGTKDFYIADPDGYIISFGGRPAAAGSLS